MASDVFPRRNLNPDSEEWGRQVEEMTRENSHRISSLELSLSGNNRSTASQMGVVGRSIESIRAQVDELASRSNATVTAPDVSVGVVSGGPWVTASTSVELPGAKGGTRASFVTVTGEVKSLNSNSAAIYVEVLSEGVVIYRESLPLTLGGMSSPPGYVPTMSGSTILPISPSGRSLVVRLHALSFQNTNTITLTGITASVLYADVI